MGPADRAMAPPGRGLVYFNNDWEGFAVENARWLSGGCGRLQPVERPPQQARDVHLR